jgi:hypothetical protein
LALSGDELATVISEPGQDVDWLRNQLEKCRPPGVGVEYYLVGADAGPWRGSTLLSSFDGYEGKVPEIIERIRRDLGIDISADLSPRAHRTSLTPLTSIWYVPELYDATITAKLAANLKPFRPVSMPRATVLETSTRCSSDFFGQYGL